MIQRNNVITTLDLSNNLISDEGINALAPVLTSLSSLNTLILINNGFGPDSCRYIADSLHKCSSLYHVNLSKNPIRCFGADSLAKGLITYHPALRELYLENCWIHNAGIECVAQSLLLNCTLKTLSLASNLFTSLGCKALCDVLRCNASLTDINMSNNDIGPDGRP